MEFVDCSCSSNYLNADLLRTFPPFFPLQELAAAQPARLSLAARTRSKFATQAGTSWRMRGGQQQLCIKCLQSLARFVCPYPGQGQRNVAFGTHRFAFVKSTRANVMQLPHGMGRPVVSPFICHTARRFQAGQTELRIQVFGGLIPYPLLPTHCGGSLANPMQAVVSVSCASLRGVSASAALA